MATTVKTTSIPGQHCYDGVELGAIFTPEILDRITTDFKIHPTDTVIVGFPKSGTTWLQEIVWLVQNDADVEASKKESVWTRIPLIESTPPGHPSGLQQVEEQSDPRIFKTHLPVKFMKSEIDRSKAKTIVIIRNQKDVLVSYYHFLEKMFKGNFMTWDQWIDNIRGDKMLYGGWPEHTKGWLEQYTGVNHVLFLRFEEMKSNPAGVVKRLANFLDKPLSDDQLDAILKHTTMSSMRNNPATNLKDFKHLNGMDFQRKGEVGDWRNHFSDEQREFVDKLASDTLKGTIFEFNCE